MKKKRMIVECAVLLIGITSMFVLTNCGKDTDIDVGDIDVGDIDEGDIDVGDIDVGDIDVGDIDVGDITVENSKDKIEETVSEEYIFDDMAEVKKIVAQSSVGYIDAKVSEDDKLRVEIEAIVTAYSEKDLEQIKKNIKIEKNINEGECALSITSKDGEDLWDWLSENIEKYNVSVRLNIMIPEELDNFVFDVECGGIEVTGLTGSINANGEVGNITVNQCQLAGDCSFETKTGNIQISLCENLQNNAVVDAVTETGNIEIDLAKNLMEYGKKEDSSIAGKIGEKYDVTANTETGIVKIGE